MRRVSAYLGAVFRLGWTGRVGKMAGVGVGMTGVTGFTAIAFVAEEPLLAVVVVLGVLLLASLIGGYRAWNAADHELQRTRDDAADEFRRFALHFSGWLKSHQINAPADLTSVLGEDYEDEQRRRLEVGEIGLEAYQVSVSSFTERQEWLRSLRVDYQKNWRAGAKEQFAWAGKAGKLDGKDYLALLYLDDFFEPEQARQIAETLERVAGGL